MFNEKIFKVFFSAVFWLFELASFFELTCLMPESAPLFTALVKDGSNPRSVTFIQASNTFNKIQCKGSITSFIQMETTSI